MALVACGSVQKVGIRGQALLHVIAGAKKRRRTLVRIKWFHLIGEIRVSKGDVRSRDYVVFTSAQSDGTSHVRVGQRSAYRRHAWIVHLY